MGELALLLLLIAVGVFVVVGSLTLIGMVGVALWFLIGEPIWRRWKSFRRRQWWKGIA